MFMMSRELRGGGTQSHGTLNSPRSGRADYDMFIFGSND
ncbi:hypothetical protein QFZ72_003071 [Bacillus sp. V2I10]|nr:hypothetical protein [Bacillus sp. V2I10]